PVAIVIARLVGAERDAWTKWGWRVNLFVLGFLAGIGGAAFFLLPNLVKGEEAPLGQRLDVRLLFAVMAVTALAGLVAAIWSRRLITSTIAVGAVPIATFAYIAIVLMPLANEMASTRPLVDAILRQGVPAESVALHFAPHLWVRDMPRELEKVRRVETVPPDAAVVISRRRNTAEIAASLEGYRKVDEFRLIGKWFDVYRR
ncbi:MAG: hypothetical protein ACXW2P_05605, partial [Thermoanaerobaculia bacterium]